MSWNNIVYYIFSQKATKAAGAEGPATVFLLSKEGKKNRFRLLTTYFLLVQKVGKDTLRGKTRSTSNAEGRVLRSSVFSLRTPRFTGAQARSAAFYFRRGVTGHMKPLLAAAAPMAVVINFRAIDKRLRWMFACGCGALLSAFSANSRQSSGSENRRTASYRRSQQYFYGMAVTRLCQSPLRGTQGIIPCACFW